MYVCLCKGLTERDVEQCLRAGHLNADDLNADDLIAALGLEDDDTCGRCAREIEELRLPPAYPLRRAPGSCGAARGWCALLASADAGAEGVLSFVRGRIPLGPPAPASP